MNIKNMGDNIVILLGGASNIESVSHCATRLRVYVKDEEKIDITGLKKQKGVIDVVKATNQYQIIVGQIVVELCDYIEEEYNLNGKSGTNVKHNTTLKEKFGSFMEMIAGCFAPIIPVLSASGFIKVLLILFTMLGIMNEQSNTYYMLNFASDTIFYFMPVALAYTSSLKFNANPIFSIVISLMILHPNWIEVVNEGTKMSIFGLPVTLTSYSGSVIPIILSVWVLSKLDRVIEKIVPKLVSHLLKPLMLILIMTVLIFVILGPLGVILGEGLATIVEFLSLKANWLAVTLLCVFGPFIAMTGMHLALIPFAVSSIDTQGFDSIILIWFLCNTIAQGASALAVFLKTKNSGLKQIALPAAISGLFGGISEPSMYGIGFKMKKPLYASMFGAGVSGLFAGIMHLKAYTFGAYSILALPAYVGSNDTRNFQIAIITVCISVIATMIATWVLGFDDTVYEEDSDEIINIHTKEVIIGLPGKGELISSVDIPDEVFSSEVMGKTIALKNNNGLVVSPVNGKVTTIFPSKHAIGILSEEGVEILIHIGIDSVKLNGEGFEVFVEVGDSINIGDNIIRFDNEVLRKNEINNLVIMVVTNSDKFNNIKINE